MLGRPQLGSVDPRSVGEVKQRRGPATFRRRRELKFDAQGNRGVGIHAPKVPATPTAHRHERMRQSRQMSALQERRR